MFSENLFLVSFLVYAAWTANFLGLVAASQLSIVGEPESVRVVEGGSVDLNCEAFGTCVASNGKDMVTANATVKVVEKSKNLCFFSPIASIVNLQGIRCIKLLQVYQPYKCNSSPSTGRV